MEGTTGIAIHLTADFRPQHRRIRPICPHQVSQTRVLVEDVPFCETACRWFYLVPHNETLQLTQIAWIVEVQSAKW